MELNHYSNTTQQGVSSDSCHSSTSSYTYIASFLVIMTLKMQSQQLSVGMPPIGLLVISSVTCFQKPPPDSSKFNVNTGDVTWCMIRNF